MKNTLLIFGLFILFSELTSKSYANMRYGNYECTKYIHIHFSDRDYYDVMKDDNLRGTTSFMLTVSEDGLKFDSQEIAVTSFNYTNFFDNYEDSLSIAGYAAKNNTIATVSFWHGSSQSSALLSYATNSDIWAGLMKARCYKR